MDLEPEIAPSQLHLARLALNEGRLTEAEAAVRGIFELGHASCDALLVFAEVQVRHGRQGPALEALQRAARAEPDNPEVQVELFNILFADRRLSDAEAAIRHAIRHAPSIAENHWRLACVLAELGHCSEAERAAAVARQIAPASSRYGDKNALFPSRMARVRRWTARRLKDLFDKG